MHIRTYNFSGKKVNYYLDGAFEELEKLVSKEKLVIVTDENILSVHPWLTDYDPIVIPAGEQHKQIGTVDMLINELIRKEADRSSFLVGVGGGVLTDITGFAAAVYMRGVRFGFVPTTILAQVDASIGGKNGVDTGLYKNLIGTIRQPDFILFDYMLLKTLPYEQWVNGFAEVIKHACIKDLDLFELLEAHTLNDFLEDHDLLASVIERNVMIKSTVVEMDEFEKGDRKLLNFGHTLGHAIENLYGLPHGHAISIGMAYACRLSEELIGFASSATQRILRLLQKYELPVRFDVDHEEVFSILKMDKKRVSNEMNFVLLAEIGQAVVKPIAMDRLQALISL